MMLLAAVMMFFNKMNATADYDVGMYTLMTRNVTMVVEIFMAVDSVNEDEDRGADSGALQRLYTKY